MSYEYILITKNSKLTQFFKNYQGLFIFILYALCYKPSLLKPGKKKKTGVIKSNKTSETSKSENTTSNTYQGLTELTNSSSQDLHEYEELALPEEHIPKT